jgi:hypothetical protein
VRACLAKQQTVGEGGATGAELKRRFRAQERFLAKFLEQGPKLIFKIRRSP